MAFFITKKTMIDNLPFPFPAPSSSFSSPCLQFWVRGDKKHKARLQEDAISRTFLISLSRPHICLSFSFSFCFSVTALFQSAILLLFIDYAHIHHCFHLSFHKTFPNVLLLIVPPFIFSQPFTFFPAPHSVFELPFPPS